MPWINWFSPFPFGNALVVADGFGNSWHTQSKHILAFRLLEMLEIFCIILRTSYTAIFCRGCWRGWRCRRHWLQNVLKYNCENIASKYFLNRCRMKGVTRQIFAAIGIFGVLVCHAAVDPCSEQYPHLGTDFVTSQSKVISILTSVCGPYVHEVTCGCICLEAGPTILLQPLHSGCLLVSTDV